MILHVYSEKNKAQQEETLAFIDSVKAYYPIVSRLTTVDDDASYWRVLMEYWGKEELVHFQQDVVPNVTMLQNLEECKYESCTHAHKLRTGYGLYAPVYDVSSYASHMPVEMQWYDPPFPKFVAGSGTALCKISKELQQQIPLGNYTLNGSHWSTIDTWLSAWMNIELNQQWHVHTPEVKHNHF